ncbi:MAG: hypothetical protein LBI19_02945 [Oscillospiraceae bacterium]|jgi:hypothetical protein|nr:hypothetical protein [Oscillospiraceae bacterium]
MVETIAGWLQGAVNGLIDIAAGLADAIFWLLPTSPFAALELAFDSTLLGHINYFLPVREALNILAAWGFAIAAWYLYQLILRWVKAIR